MSQIITTLTDNPMITALVVLALFGLLLLYVIQRKHDNYDLRWLITDEITKQPSLHKLGQLGALLISSWGFVYETIHGRMSEWYFGLYMGAWAAAEVANKWLSRGQTPVSMDPMAPQCDTNQGLGPGGNTQP